MKDVRKELRNRNLNNLIALGGLKFDEVFYPYTSGKIGPYFLESLEITSNGDAYRQARDDMCRYIAEFLGFNSFEFISGGETKDWDFSNAVASELGYGHIKLYKNREPKGAKFRGETVLHIADINNKGSSVRDYWVPQIRDGGGIIDDILFFVDRMEEGVEEMEKLTINRHALIELNRDVWQFLFDNSVIKKENYNALNMYQENREKWGIDTLRRNPQKLKDILESKDPKLQGAGFKILNVGYPQIRDELIHSLTKLGYSGPVKE